MTVPSPEKLRLNRGISPFKISQMPSKSMPIFLVSFIVILRISLYGLNDIGLSECWDAASCAATADIHSDQALARSRISADVGKSA